ncbi:pleckstrin domain-containing protein 2 [Lasius niger]|uniref:Pleckstrin domain-containing protein 2 n=1 Tax=Lasius niger TaxID=67767 RepID=A0A0J7NNG3_LASNI|nr:pleckstrin domain-containing protein 2 [Lasius niger]
MRITRQALATPALSLSCGSMTLDSPTTVTSVSMGGTIHRREDTATSFRTLTSIDVHSPATPSQVPAPRQMHATSQQRISSTGRISPSNSSPPEFPPPRPLPRHPWQRSASCRELYASSFEDSGKARPRDDKVTAEPPLDPFQLASQGELDNPITRYDESNRSYSAASSKLPSLDHDSVPERVYSSSYPGTSSLSTESGHEESGPAGDLSHDDLSHDSYELLEREHEFEYPESYSSPHDEPISDQSDEGIEHEMFQMDSETDSFVKHRSLKPSERQQYKSALTDLKNTRAKSIDRYSAVSKTDGDYVITESRIQRSCTQIERKFEMRHANSVEQSSKMAIPHQDSARKDPVIMQVQKQKVSVLNELKNLKPKYKITHVDSEVLRDEGIMRPKSRIDDDLSPVDGNGKTVLDHSVRGRTTRARSIASLDDHPPRLYVETGSLGRGHKSRDRKSRDSDIKLEKVLSKERRSVEREERKRIERDSRRIDKSDSRERRSMDRLDSRKSDNHGHRSIDRIDIRELRRSIERLDVREKSYEHLDSREKSAFYYNDFSESRGKSVDRLDFQGLRSSMEYLRSPKERSPKDRSPKDRSPKDRSPKDRSPKERSPKERSPKERSTRHSDTRERRERSIERIDSRESRKSRAASIDYERHTLERFDSGNKSPFERLTPKEQRRMSIERLDSQKFDFDPRAIERLKSLERYEQRDRIHERKAESRSAERKSLEKLDSRERKYLGRLESREGRSLECLDFDNAERRKNIEKIEYKDQKRSRSKPEKGKPEEKPRERDDWRSLEKARKDNERRERERQAKLSLESRTETVIGVPHEMENLKQKAVFAEYEPKVVGGVVLGFEETALPGHIPVERTKSDPNPARQRLGSNSKRHVLMHQKSIDLTPADSGDEEPFSDSAATVQKTNVDIPYTLHKRHVMNGTASDEKSESDSSKTSKNVKSAVKDLPKLPLKMMTEISYFDLTKLSSIDKTGSKLSPDKPKSGAITATRPKSILSPSDKPKSILSPTSKLSPTDPKSIVCSLSPTNRSPSKANAKTQSPDKLSQKGGSLDRNRAEVIINEDYTCKKSSSLDKKPSKLSPVEPNVTIISALEKRSPKKSPTDSNVTIVSVIQKKKSTDGAPRSPTNVAKTADAKSKVALNFADVVGMEMKQNLERKAKLEKDSLKAPDDSLEKQDSIEKIPLPEIPGDGKADDLEKITPDDQAIGKIQQAMMKELVHSFKRTVDELSDDDNQRRDNIQSVVAEVHISAAEIKPEKPPIPEKPKTLEKPSIPEKTKRILERIESKFSEVSKNSATRISRPKIIDTGFDDFVDPVADLPLDEVPVKPALELDSLKVPEFVPFMLRPHAEPLRSKSLSLAEEKAPIDTLLSPEVENKHFVQDVSPKRMKRVKSEPKKDFKKQSKSLEGDKPPLKKSASKESRAPVVSTKIDKSKLKLGEMPQEIIIIDSTDVAPEISIVQKGRSKSVTRLSDKPFSTSKDDKEETKSTSRAKSASVDDELIKGTIKSEKSRPKSLGISKSLGSTEKKDSVEKISPKRTIIAKAVAKVMADSKAESKSAIARDAVSKQDSKSTRAKVTSKVEAASEEANESKQSKLEKDSKPSVKPDVVIDQPVETKRTVLTDESKEPSKESSKEPTKDSAKKTALAQDLTQSPLVLRKPGQTPILFARARLGLSEGSGIGALQRQGATQSPTAQRRAKSLDAAVISVHRLPPANAFSSKDDTVDVSESLEDRENAAAAAAEEAAREGTSAISKAQSAQMEASPNHRSDSTDHTTIPEICTDSLSVTETSAQYLESPLTECNEIVASIDLIPYEGQESGRQIPFISYINGNENVTESVKVEEATKFIDQSSAESGCEQEASQKSSEAMKADVPRAAADQSSVIFVKSASTEVVVCEQTELSKDATEDHDGEGSAKIETIKSPTRSEDLRTKIEDSDRKSPSERDDVPNVTISVVREDEKYFLSYYDQDEPPDMVKSPIQISIEECSDDEGNPEEEEEERREEEEIDEREEEENKRHDSLDTSEDTLDALDTQVQMRGVDSEMSSPDYGVDKMDEKTLVEVELTPEYLEMKREDEETAEELPEDEPVKEAVEIADSNRLSIDRKLRLSTERSRSEDTNTWTPDREDPDSSSCSIARPLGIGQIQPIVDRREIALIEGARSGSLDDDNSNGSQPAPKHEMSATWKSFPQESSGSSSLEEGWVPQDENNAQQSQSEDSNGQNEDSFQEDLADFPGTFIYPIGPEILANYGAFSLSRTLSRISERSTTSEQDKSDLEDSFKPSSRSPSLDDESLMSSDHQPSLSSDPPSGTALPSVSDDRRTSSELPDIPIDVIGGQEDDSRSPRTNRRSRLQLQSSEDWPSPPSSPVFDTPVVSHVETFYMEIKPEEAVKVTVTDSTETPVHGAERDSDSSDENRTLHDDLHSTFLEDGQSSTSATTVDGTVKIAVKPKSNSYITGSSHSEDTSMGLSMSEWSSSNNTVRQFCQYSGTKSDDNSLAELGASISDWSGSTTVIPQQYYTTAADKSQSDTTTSERSATSMRPNSKCQTADTSSLPSPPSPSSLPLPVSPPLPSPPATATSPFRYEDEEAADSAMIQQREAYEESLAETFEDDDLRQAARMHGDEFDEARRFIESQFDEHRRSRRYDDDNDVRQQQGVYPEFAGISPPRITLRNEYDEAIDDHDFQSIPEDETTLCADDTALPIPEEDEDQLYDNVPAMKYSSSDQVRMEVGRGDSSEDMHEKYADLTLQSRLADDEWSSLEERRDVPLEREKPLRATGKFDRGFSEPSPHEAGRYQGTRSTERPVMVPIRAKSTPYYSTTSQSGESTTSSPPMPIRTQIRTKTLPYSSNRSPQSEGDTSSSMDSPAHTPDRGQRAFRRKRQQNTKRRHRVVVDLEVKDGHIVSSTDSSFDVTTIPPPLLTEGQNLGMEDDDEDDEMSETKDERRRQQQR